MNKLSLTYHIPCIHRFTTRVILYRVSCLVEAAVEATDAQGHVGWHTAFKSEFLFYSVLPEECVHVWIRWRCCHMSPEMCECSLWLLSPPPSNTQERYDFILLYCQNLRDRELSLGGCTYKCACVVPRWRHEERCPQILHYSWCGQCLQILH